MSQTSTEAVAGRRIVDGIIHFEDAVGDNAVSAVMRKYVFRKLRQRKCQICEYYSKSMQRFYQIYVLVPTYILGALTFFAYCMHLNIFVCGCFHSPKQR